MPTDLLTHGGQTLQLLPERCVLWREAGILILSDLHLGKAAHLRHHGMPIPEGNTADDLARLTQVIHRTGARELILCGDFFHAPAAQSPAIIGLVESWRAAHPGLTVSLVIGNHDQGRALPPPSCGINPVGHRCHRAPFHFVHDPAHILPDGFHFTGHLHPVAALPGPRPLKAPCFWWQAASQTLVLPAFGSITAGVPVQPAPGDTLHAIFNDTILPVPGQLYHRKTS
jgi:DNA ligase-associated metallophosphoesterase